MALRSPNVARVTAVALLLAACAAGLATNFLGAWGRTVAALVALVALPGWGLQRWLLRGSGAGPLLRCAVGSCAPLALHALVATIAGACGAGPLPPALATAALGVLAALTAAPSHAGERRVPAQLARDRALALLLVLPVIPLLAAPAELGLRSDVYAHVAAVRACVEEDAVFPRHEFYAARADEPPDPRFGTGHALYAAIAVLSRVPPLTVWAHTSALMPLIWALATAALSAAVCASRRGRWLALLLWLGAYGGSYYDPLRVAAYPQWLGLALAFTALALGFDARLADTARRRWAAAALLAATGGLHVLPLLLGAGLLLAALLTVPLARRALWWGIAWRCALLAAPVLAIRFVVSNGNVNPIHQLPWYPLRWKAGLYSARPDYLIGWLYPLGLAALLLLPGLWRRGPAAHAARWSTLVAAGALLWLGVPWLLTASVGALGFLPLRFVMAVLFPLHWGLWADGRDPTARPRRSFPFVYALVAGLGLVALVGDLRAPFQQTVDTAFVRSPQWSEIGDELARLPAGSATVLSDPYTMLAVRACTPQRVVSVPEGRSSPRDALALQRLRDTWRALSPSTDAQVTDSLLVLYGVTHILLNHTFREALSGFEYAVAPAAFPGETARLEENPQRFQLLREAGALALYAVVPQARMAPAPARAPCTEAALPREGTAVALHDGFTLLDGQIQPATAPGNGPALALVRLGYTGTGPAPYRSLILRADRVPSPVPRALQAVAKPVRKLLEVAQRRRYRMRWTVVPRQSTCPTTTLSTARALDCELALPLAANLAPGRYQVTVQVVQESEFTPLSLRDFLRDDDALSGPVIGQLNVP